MKRALLALLLLAPLAQAQDPALLEVDVEDAPNDVMGFTIPERPATRPSADILNFSTRVVGDDLRLYVRIAGPPKAPDDSLEARIWFKDSVNGSFDAVDLELLGAREPDDRLKVNVRRDRYENVTFVPSRYGLENGTLWILSFPASVLADATCFDPYVRTNNLPKQSEGVQASDGAGPAQPTCVQGKEPEPPLPDLVSPSFGFPQASPAPEAPGSRTPGAPLALIVLAIALLAFRWRRAP